MPTLFPPVDKEGGKPRVFSALYTSRVQRGISVLVPGFYSQHLLHALPSCQNTVNWRRDTRDFNRKLFNITVSKVTLHLE